MDNKRKFYEEQTVELIKSVTHFQENEENFTLCVDFALDNFIYHQYLEVDPFKVKKSITGFCEKFTIQAEDSKSQKLHDLATRYYDLLATEDAHKRGIGYAVLALLVHLSGSCESSESVLQEDNELEQSTSEKINWSEYLREEESDSFAHSEASSIWSGSDDDDDSLGSSACHPFLPPPSCDSGIEVSPDGSTIFEGSTSVNALQYLKTGKTRKTWDKRIPYWDPRYRVTKLEARTNSKQSYFTKIWEKHLAEESPIYTPETNTVLNETIVVREILWMLHGLKDLYVFPWINGHYEVLKHIHMKHITEETLESILSSLCQYGEKFCNLLDFVNYVLPNNSDMKGHCHTYQAYGSGLLFFLNKYRAVLTSYEKLVISKKIMTVIQLTQKLKPHFDELELLFDIHTKVLKVIPENDYAWQHSTYLLDTLWKQLVDYSIWTKNRTTIEIPFLLFLTSLRPFMSILEGAILRGQFSDSNAEFLVQRNEEVGILDERFWSRALSFRKLPPDLEECYFLKPLFSQILLASKSMEMLHNLQYHHSFDGFPDCTPDLLFAQFIENFQKLYSSHISEDVSSEETTEKTLSSASSDVCGSAQTDHVLDRCKQQFNKMKDCIDVKKHWRLCQKAMDVIQPDSPMLLYSVVERTLLPCIENACHMTNKELMRFLKENHDLVFHLSVMQKYFLMTAGDIMFSFYSEVFDKILEPSFRVDITFINNVLTEAVSSVDVKTSERLVMSLKDISQPYKNDPLYLLSLLNLSYDVEWPINMILGRAAQERYCQIFGFLLQIKCAKYYLDGLYWDPLDKPTTKQLSKLEQWFSKEPPKMQKIHGMYILRMKILHFINGFHNYIMRRTLYSSGVELNEKIENAESFEDILIDHQQYLSNLLTHCLFDPKLPYLREEMLKVLSLALKFQNLWLTEVENICVDDLKTMETEFSSSVNLIKSYLSNPSVRGKSTYLDDLANAIASESHLRYVFL